ncbi:MAG: hypothetical protein JSW57_05150 [Flavobacteriaceae bacterium]|nr:MAG: hypothetical protein JSW57_05150 [Flavobacteriaceae bacterium]
MLSYYLEHANIASKHNSMTNQLLYGSCEATITHIESLFYWVDPCLE